MSKNMIEIPRSWFPDGENLRPCKNVVSGGRVVLYDVSDPSMIPDEKYVILSAKDASTVIGVQNGTTGQFYVEGDADWGFDGFAVTCTGYKNGSMAVQDMINGNLNYVVIQNTSPNRGICVDIRTDSQVKRLRTDGTEVQASLYEAEHYLEPGMVEIFCYE